MLRLSSIFIKSIPAGFVIVLCPQESSFHGLMNFSFDGIEEFVWVVYLFFMEWRSFYMEENLSCLGVYFVFVLFLILRCFLFLLVAGWSRQPTAPSWDKRLSTSVSKIPWKKICERKRFESSFQNILEWNDSAVKEAAQNAKARFCAKISGLPCDASLPDPDLYIEDVDWNAYVDPRLLSA